MSNEEQELDGLPEQSSKKGVIIAAVVSLLLGVGVGFGAATALGGDEEDAPAAAGSGEEDAVVTETQIVDLGEFTINLRNTAGGRVLKMKLSVEALITAVPVIEVRSAQLRDAVLMLASDYTVAELDGLDNRMAFRDEIHTRLASILGEEQVTRVYFTDFVVQ